MSYDKLKIKKTEALNLINHQIQKGDELFKKGNLLIDERSIYNISFEIGIFSNLPSSNGWI